MTDYLRVKINKWRSRIGYDEALKRLTTSGISLSLSQKLLAGTYQHHPTGLVLKVLTEVLEE